MNRPDEEKPLMAAVRGQQFKPTVILLASTALMITWKYFGSLEFYHERLSSLLDIQGDQPAIAAAYSFACCLLLLGVVPVLIVKLVLHENLADYGVRLGNRARTVRCFLLIAPLFLLIGYLSSKDPSVLSQYPINRIAGASPSMFGFHLATYLMFYLGWEFCFRGFIQFGLRDSLGLANALLIQVMASTLLHIGKPAVESYGAIAGGIIWGIVAYRTQSLLAGLLLHCLLGMSLDWFICYM